MAIRIAVVEDDDIAAKTIQDYIDRYSSENTASFSVVRFNNAVSLLFQYTSEYDIIFMDIQMPYLNGIDAAHRLRSIDEKVILIFTTNLRQYAIEGYEVDATGYLVKPINYYDFALKLEKAIRRLPFISRADIVLSTKSGNIRLALENIRYVEISGHWVLFHTLSGEFSHYSTLNKIEEQISSETFVRCNSCYLVNLDYVQRIEGQFVVLNDGTRLKISQPKKQHFSQCFQEHFTKRTSRRIV